jgi:hypothetical protein
MRNLRVLYAFRLYWSDQQAAEHWYDTQPVRAGLIPVLTGYRDVVLAELIG